MRRLAFTIFSLGICLVPFWSEASPQHDDASMNNRGDHVMGFGQDKTTHHFELTKAGGIIQVRANDPTDSETRDHIRMHLQHISKAFAAGDFQDPMEVHAEVPPGVPVMQQLKSTIAYHYESVSRGGRVVIQTQDANALEAIHEYLQYQIRVHKTGDSLKAQ
jgi:hypothetical protein